MDIADEADIQKVIDAILQKEGWSDCLRLELKDFNINVVVLEPGAIATEFGDVMSESMLNHSGQGAIQN